MSKRRSQGALVSCLLGAACLGLAGLIRHELTNPPRPPASEEALAEPVTVEPLPPELVLSLPALDIFSAVVERPVFSPTRRPEEAPAPPPPTQEPVEQHPGFSLAGIVISEKGRFVLTAQHGGAGSVMRVREGRSINGWKVATVEADRAVFRRGETEALMVLEFFGRSGGDLEHSREVEQRGRSRR